MSPISNTSRRLPALIVLGVSLAALWLGSVPAQAAAPSPAAAPVQAAAPSPAVAPAQAAVPTEVGLTPEQERVVLRLIDDICADTWCSGDYAFAFRRFSCHEDRGTCRLALRIAPYGDGALRWRSRSGTVHGFARFEQMVRTSESGQQSLEWDFYEAVSTVITGIEATLPVPPVPPVPAPAGS